MIEPSLKANGMVCQYSGKVQKLKVLKTEGNIEKLEQTTKCFKRVASSRKCDLGLYCIYNIAGIYKLKEYIHTFSG